MGTYSDAFLNLMNSFKTADLLDYEYYDFSNKHFAVGAQSRICHIAMKNDTNRNSDSILMVFTIGLNSDRVVIQSEGKSTTNPSSTYPQKIEALKLAQKANWKYFALAISPEDFANVTIRDYVVAIESAFYGTATVCVLDQTITDLEAAGYPDFYRCKVMASNNVEYTMSFVKKTKLIEYLKLFDNRYDNVDIEEDNEKKFKNWLTSLIKEDGIRKYSDTTVKNYTRYIGRNKNFVIKYADQLAPYTSVFQIPSVAEFDRIISPITDDPGFAAFDNDAHNGNRSISASLAQYRSYLAEEGVLTVFSKMPRNRILFGAPGTGKSFSLDLERKGLLYGNPTYDESVPAKQNGLGIYERVTFHPDYSYANFVGTYKPVPAIDATGKETITYEYVPGPFMRVYANALECKLKGESTPCLLIIEEINRANVAAVFGDVFQLLDRDEHGVSEYPIQASEDMRKYLAKRLGKNPDDFAMLRIPSNMYIWATMNSADQGVFPMDTAFKRRWDFTYLGIDDKESELGNKTVVLGKGANQRRVEWNKLRKAINAKLSEFKINEDKQLGPFFIAKSIVVPEDDEIDNKLFCETFKNKVIMYLFEDAAKQKRSTLFEGCQLDKNRYSEICKDFDERGIFVFCQDVVNDTKAQTINPVGAEGENNE